LELLVVLVSTGAKEAEVEEGPRGTHLEDLAAMGAPIVAQAPDAILVAVEDPDLAIDGAGRAAVAIGIECDSLDEVPMAVGEVQIEVCLLIDMRRGFGEGMRRHGRVWSRADSGVSWRCMQCWEL
jgi:hypothetical protein